jgi:hypothetical protein
MRCLQEHLISGKECLQHQMQALDLLFKDKSRCFSEGLAATEAAVLFQL